MTEKHTPEPREKDKWSVAPDIADMRWDLVSNNSTVCSTGNKFLADRIAACVNALRFVPDRAFEGEVDREFRTDEGGIHSITIRWGGDLSAPALAKLKGG